MVRRRVTKSSFRRKSFKRSRQQVHHFRRSGTVFGYSGNAVNNPLLFWRGSVFDDIVNFAEFTVLYDQYRINYVVDRFWLKIDPSAQTAATASFPKLYWSRDLDDSGVAANLNELRERGNCRIKVMNPNRPVVIKWKPNVLNSVYRTGVTDSSATPLWGQWIDMSATNLIHYGYKAAIDDLTNVNYRVDIERTVYFSCKNTR